MSAETDIIEYADGMLWYSSDGSMLTIGFTEKALDLAGAVSEIEFPEMNDEFLQDDWVAELHGKDNDIPVTAPRAIRVEEINEGLQNQSTLLEDDPTGDAWLFRASIIA